MDTGRFFRHYRVTAAWIGCPLLIILAAHALAQSYRRTVASDLDSQRVLMEWIPEIQARLELADEALATFRAPAGGSGSVEELNMLFIEPLDQLGFNIDSVRISETTGRNNEIPGFSVELEGRGSLLSLIRFFDFVQKPEYLSSVESVRLAVAQADRTFSGQIRLRYYHPPLLMKVNE